MSEAKVKYTIKEALECIKIFRYLSTQVTSMSPVQSVQDLIARKYAKELLEEEELNIDIDRIDSDMLDKCEMIIADLKNKTSKISSDIRSMVSYAKNIASEISRLRPEDLFSMTFLEAMIPTIKRPRARTVEEEELEEEEEEEIRREIERIREKLRKKQGLS
jgi:lipoate-protein ligase A